MARICRLGLQILNENLHSTSIRRSLSLSATHNLKEFREQRQGKEIIVEGVYVPSPREKLLVKPEEKVRTDGKTPCYMCALDLDIKHTDVLILSQFVRSDGCMLSRRVTGLCARQQKRVGILVSMARKAGLMINLTPANCKKDPTRRTDWKQFNTYFDEKTIFMKRQPNPLDRYKR